VLTHRAVEERIGFAVLVPAMLQACLAGHPELLLSAGRPAAATEIQIVDSTGARVPDGVVGEVVA
jgi:hypothetical protein